MAMAQAASGKRRSFYADLDHLRSHFDSLDQDKTGYIGYSELKQLVQKMSGIEEAILPELMEKLDRDKDGKVSFDDFQTLFEVERESMSKKIKITAPDVPPSVQKYGLDGSLTQTAVSPSNSRRGRRLPETPTVVLRTKKGRRQQSDREFGHLSPIHAGSSHTRPQSQEYPDVGPAHMQYLTGFDMSDSASPQLKRSSKVLSWINESEDFILEDTGDDLHLNEIPSPPMSPSGGGEEVSHVVSVLESVINRNDVDKDAIAKLCAHVKADQQEKEELLALLEHLDKKKVGSVSLEEFVRGLQAVKNTAQVASTPFKSPQHVPLPRRHTISTMQSIPRLSEPFTTPTHTGSKLSSTPLASTPVGVQPAHSNIILTVLDPDHSGYVKVDSLVEQIQQMGVEADHNSSLEEALAEAVTVDPSGRVSVTEFTSSLEGAILTEGKTNNFLRQIALKSFRSEIHNLRSQIHQISLERDKVKHSLNRTLEENKKLVQEGEEHVDMVTKQSELKLKQQEYELTQRHKETERSRMEEQMQIQDRYTAAFANLQQQVDQLKSEEEKLRADLKLAQDELTQVTKQLENTHKELSRKESTISALQRDLESRSDHDLIDDEHQLSHIHELENEVSYKGTLISELQEKLRETQDRFDLLTADNEKMKQKYLSAKRDLQRQKSSARHKRKNSSERPLSGYGRSQKPKRPLSGSHFGRSSPIKPRILRSPLDLAISAEENHPVLYEDMDEPSSGHSEPEPISSVEEQDLEEVFLTHQYQEDVSDQMSNGSCSTPTDEESTGEDDVYSRSTASLMEEIHNHEQRSLLEKKIKQLEEERFELQAQYQLLEQQLRSAEEEDRKVMLRELDRTKQKQQELDRLILALGKQSKSLSKTRLEINSRLQVAEQSLASQLQGLRSSLTDNAGSNSTGNLADLIDELDAIRSQLESERKSHDTDITSLKNQLSQAEEYGYSQIDQSLKLEEEKAQIKNELASIQLALESERRAHETEVNILLQKLDNAKHVISVLEENQHESLLQVREELEQAQTDVKQYRQQTDKLKSQLAEAQEKLAAKHIQIVTELKESAPNTRELADSHTTRTDERSREFEQHKRSLEELQQQNVEMSDQNKQLRNTVESYSAKMISSQNEVAALQKELVEIQTEIEHLRSTNMEQLSHTEKLQAELQRSRKRADEQLAEQSRHFKKEIESSKVQYELQLERVSKEVEAGHTREKELKEKLLLTDTRYENALTEVAKLSAKEGSQLKRIELLEESESLHKQEILQLRKDYQEEMAKFHETKFNVAQQQVSAQQRVPKSPKRDGIEETDYIPETFHSPRKLPYSSSQESHEKIIGQMKDQLDELQKILVLQVRNGAKGGEAELTLVQDLIASNEALDNEVRQSQKSYLEQQQRLSAKLTAREESFTELQLQILEEKKKIQALALATSQEVLGLIRKFNSTSNDSLSDYGVRVEEASSKVANIRKLLQDRDTKHLNVLDHMVSDLDHSRAMCDGYKQEIDRLSQELDQSQKSLEDLQSDALQLPQVPAESRRVDEESGQIFHSQGEPVDLDSRTSTVLTQREEEICDLKEQLDKVVQSEKLAKSRCEEVESQLISKERQLKEKEKKIQDLESQLPGLVNEHVESVVQYVEVQPLEGMNEALHFQDRQDNQAEKKQVHTQTESKPSPVTLSLPLEEAEELAALRQFHKTLEMQHQQAIKDIEAKYEAELSATNEVIDEHSANLRELYLSVANEETDKRAERLTHSQLIAEIKREINTLKTELSNEQSIVSEMESTLTRKMAEHDQLEAQIQTEHEEEVKALHQQKQQLARQLEDVKIHFHRLIKEQDQHNNVLVQDLVNAKSDLEERLTQKTEESLSIYQRLGDLMDEKKVLMDIVEHLCIEAGKQIDVV